MAEAFNSTELPRDKAARYAALAQGLAAELDRVRTRPQAPPSTKAPA